MKKLVSIRNLNISTNTASLSQFDFAIIAS